GSAADAQSDALVREQVESRHFLSQMERVLVPHIWVVALGRKPRAGIVQRQPSAGATCVRSAPTTCAVNETPSWLGPGLRPAVESGSAQAGISGLEVGGLDVSDTRPDSRCWWPAPCAAVPAVVVVVDVPDRDRGRAVLLAVEISGIEQFLGQDSLVALDLSIVLRGVRLGLLMAGALAYDPREVTGPVARPVVGNDTVDVGDAVGCEPDFGSGQERRRGGSLLIRQRLCVGESGEAVDGRVQVGVTAFRASRFRSTDSLGLVAV